MCGVKDAGRFDELAQSGKLTPDEIDMLKETGVITPEEAAMARDALSGLRVTRRVSLREQYLGRTPGKKSRTGDEVRERMREEGTLKYDDELGEDVFLGEDGVWRPVDRPNVHMGHHPVDAVDYWNETGRYHGAKSSEVREWMLDSDNFRFEYGLLNSARGGATTSRDLPPENTTE